MSRIGDLLIGMQEDAECVLGTCQTLEKFIEEMRKLNTLYTPGLLEDLAYPVAACPQFCSWEFI